MFKRKNKVLIKKLHPDAIMPKYQTKGAVAFDLHALGNYDVYKNVVMVRTGIAVAIPDGYEINCRARSGLSVKYPNYMCIVGGGTIDSDYRGEILVPVVNNAFRKNPWAIKHGDRIIQCVVAPIERAELVEAQELPQTERGTGGYGHTGR